jgi:hypothetical protein
MPLRSVAAQRARTLVRVFFDRALKWLRDDLHEKAAGSTSPLRDMTVLDGFDLAPSTRKVIERATALTMEAQGGPLTTTFLLMAMVDLGSSKAGTPLHRLHGVVTDREPYAYQGTITSYLAWYRGSNRSPEDRQSSPAPGTTMTPYVYGVLMHAQEIAQVTAASQIEDRHLVAALLTYAPDKDQIPPGAQYALTLFQPGLATVQRVVLEGVEAELAQSPAAEHVPAWRRACGLREGDSRS